MWLHMAWVSEWVSEERTKASCPRRLRIICKTFTAIKDWSRRRFRDSFNVLAHITIFYSDAELRSHSGTEKLRSVPFAPVELSSICRNWMRYSPVPIINQSDQIPAGRRVPCHGTEVELKSVSGKLSMVRAVVYRVIGRSAKIDQRATTAEEEVQSCRTEMTMVNR